MPQHKIFAEDRYAKSSKIYAGLLIGLFLSAILLFHFLYTRKEKSCQNLDTRLPHVIILAEVLNFGSNPGNLRMYHYIPRPMKKNMPLVLALHGCTQNAADYALISGWNRLADRFGFMVVYAEQKEKNNMRNCFNWYYKTDTRRGKGEAMSIYQMIRHMKSKYPVNQNKIFVTGLSAGGAMTMVMLSAYPDLFSGGAVMAGLPYTGGAVNNRKDAYNILDGKWDLSPSKWAKLAKKAYPQYRENYPKLLVMHGKKDRRVSVRNVSLITRQWTALHQSDENEDVNKTFRGVTIKKYRNPKGQIILETYIFPKMGHAIAIDPGDRKEQGGYPGYMGHAEDQNFFSSYWTGVSWGIINP